MNLVNEMNADDGIDTDLLSIDASEQVIRNHVELSSFQSAIVTPTVQESLSITQSLAVESLVSDIDVVPNNVVGVDNIIPSAQTPFTTNDTRDNHRDDDHHVIEDDNIRNAHQSVSFQIGPQHFDLIKLIGEGIVPGTTDYPPPTHPSIYQSYHPYSHPYIIHLLCIHFPIGAFGKVLLVRNRLDKCLYAMKVISKKLLKKKNNIQYMRSERDILTKLRHPFIVKLHFAFKSETKLFLVMDFLSKIYDIDCY